MTANPPIPLAGNTRGRRPAPRSKDERALDSIFPAEHDRARARREIIAGPVSHGPGQQTPTPPDDLCGLALSGGGIRSATFSLGVLQALSRARAPNRPSSADPLDDPRDSMLACFDYLSTVSGGGYIGAFFCSLFVPGRLGHPPAAADAAREQKIPKTEPPGRAEERQAAVAAYRVFQHEPPGRIRSAEDYTQGPTGRGPLALLRESGRYLAPGGAGDLVYVIALAIRNWLAIHYVIGTFVAATFALLALARVGLINLWSLYAGFEDWLLDQVPCAAMIGACDAPAAFWWSPFWLVPLLVVVLWLAPAFTAFWLTYPRKGQDDKERPRRASSAAAVALLLGLASFALAGTSALVALFVRPANGTISLLSPHEYVLVLAGVVALGGVLFHWGTAGQASISAQRVTLTRIGATAFLVLVATAVVAVADTLSQTFYLAWAAKPERELADTLTPAGLIAAAVWVFRRVAMFTDEKKTGLLDRLPVGLIAGAAGLLLFFAIATGWGFLVQWIIWQGVKPVGADALGSSLAAAFAGPDAQERLMLAAIAAGVLVVLAVASGQFSGFLNLSSLQAFYGARLTRAYLGASNGVRFKSAAMKQREALSAAEPVKNDQIAREEYYKSAAPQHIINVTVNQTIDPAERLVQRDRKGKPLAVLATGFSIDQKHYDFRDDQTSGSINKGTLGHNLMIGQWIGISGAAFTTGLGRSTSLGTSLALGLANVRLGMWWSSGHGTDQARGFARAFKRLFKTQAFLFYELTAMFHGLRREWHYLSDGGHFENTGLYELLRPKRGLRIIVACDNGCDPLYRFQDLATLIRTARIDHRVRIEVDHDISSEPGLDEVFATPEAFQTAAADTVNGGLRSLGDKCAVLLNVYHTSDDSRANHTPDCRIILLKPRAIASAPVDVREYQAAHSDFPQQTTTDQFFDEAQWESYRCLGSCIAKRVFGDNGDALWKYLARSAASPAVPLPAIQPPPTALVA